MRDFHTLRVAGITPPELDGGAATSVTFDVPPDLAQTFSWQAGQHLTLRFHLGGGAEQRRCYSISNPPGDALRITVKRVHTGGLVSNHIGDALAPGDLAEVMPPFGRFHLIPPGATARRTHYVFGAGSGITPPLFAMIRAVLEREPWSAVHLIYGNAEVDSILFHEALDGLQAAFPERFTLRHILSAPSLWSWFTPPWRKGRMNAEAVAAAIAETPPPEAQDVHYWICGPGGMNMDVRTA